MGSEQPQLSRQALRLLSEIMEAPSDAWYGLELAQRADLKSGTIYPLLARLERLGWVTSTWEDVDPSSAKRPRRRLYYLSGEGQRVVPAVLERARAELAPRRPVARPKGMPRTA